MPNYYYTCHCGDSFVAPNAPAIPAGRNGQDLRFGPRKLNCKKCADMPPAGADAPPTPAEQDDAPIMELISGALVNLANPDYADVRITDIATALSHESRFNGHTKVFYSVALHCIIGTAISRPQSKYAFLMHDAAEAALKDITSMLKSILPDYRALEEKHNAAIARRFHVPDDEKEYLKQIDKIMLMAELVVLRDYDDAAARAELPFDGGTHKYEKALKLIEEQKNSTIEKCRVEFIRAWLDYAPPAAMRAELANLNVENAYGILRKQLLGAG